MRKVILLFLLFLSVAGVRTQGQNITFSHLTTDDGLSQFSVNSLYIDERGIIWIGTREGLNRYNGNDIKSFKLNKNDPNSLFSNTVLRITGNKNGKVYLLCTDGVAEFDLTTQRFKTLLQGNVDAIYFNEKLYIGKREEVFVYNESTGNFDLYYHLAGKDITLSCLHLDEKKNLWMGTTSNGLYCLSGDKKISQPVTRGNIASIYEDSSKELWICTWEEGLYRIKTDSTIENFRHDPKNPNSICTDFVRSCCEDNAGNLWIGTFHGLNRYEKSTGKFQLYTANANKPDGLTHSSIWCIVKDEQGTIWLGTYFGGVNYFNPEYEIYTRYKVGDTEKAGLSSPIVGRMTEDKDGICYQRVSLDDVLPGEEQLRRIEAIADPYAMQPQSIMEEQESRRELYDGLKRLTQREQTYLLYRYGFTDGEEHPLIGTAIYFHLTKGRAKKTEEQAMDNLWLELPWWFI